MAQTKNTGRAEAAADTLQPPTSTTQDAPTNPALTFSRATDKIIPALLEVQKKLGRIGKDARADVGKYKYDYATLPHILNDILEHVNGAGIVIIQGETGKEGDLTVVTRAAHVSGQWVQTEVPIKALDIGPQSTGIATTYGRRYGIGLIFCLNIDKDTDGVEQKKWQQEVTDILKRVPDDAADIITELGWKRGDTRKRIAPYFKGGKFDEKKLRAYLSGQLDMKLAAEEGGRV